MKILLVEPAKSPRTIAGEDIHLYEPLALEYLAAGVKKDNDVEIVDLRLDEDFQDVFERVNPDIVGITSYTVHVNIVQELFKKVKEWAPNVLTVVGGHHATVAPQDFDRVDIDLVVMGEGVNSFREIAARHDTGKTFEGIPGVGFRSNGRFVSADPVRVDDLDSLPFPDRSFTARYRDRYFSEWMRPLASLRTSKGCPYRCRFCALWRLAGGRYFKRDPHRIVEELAKIDEK